MGWSTVFHLKFGTAIGLILERECVRDHGWPWCKVHLLPTLSIQFDLWGLDGGQ